MIFLFPLLKMGLTMENFSHDGNIPEAKDQLHIYAKGELLVFAYAFIILVGILTKPRALEYFKDFRIFSNST